FLTSSQEMVSGTVELQLAPYRFYVIGITSPNDLMKSSYGQYGEANLAWTGQEARGFAKVFSTQTKIFNSIHDGKN
ncbi:MAG: argininosuccinate synthase, partial [Cyclobacteriaceae bacterium]